MHDWKYSGAGREIEVEPGVFFSDCELAELCHLHNAEIARLVARAEEAERRLASGALVPVKDGDALTVRLCPMRKLFTCEHPGVWQQTGAVFDGKYSYWFAKILNICTGEEVELIETALVQPVRFVPIVEGRNDE